MITTVIILYNHQFSQYYVRLYPGIIDGVDKDNLLKSMQAVNAGEYDYDKYPENCNRLYFQEFDEPDTNGAYFNINGDRPVYDLIQQFGRDPEYHI